MVNPHNLESLAPAERPAFPARLIQDVTGNLASLDVTAYTGMSFRAYAAAQALAGGKTALQAWKEADSLIRLLDMTPDDVEILHRRLKPVPKPKGAKADG